jgi:hypothetical protein
MTHPVGRGDRLERPVGREEPAALEVPAPGAGQRVEARDERLSAIPVEEASPVVERVGERPQRIAVIRQEIRDHDRFIGLADGLAAQRTELPPTEVYREEG